MKESNIKKNDLELPKISTKISNSQENMIVILWNNAFGDRDH